MADKIEPPVEEKVPEIDPSRVAEEGPSSEDEKVPVAEVKAPVAEDKAPVEEAPIVKDKAPEDVPAGGSEALPPKRPSFASTGTVIDLPPAAKTSTPRRPKLRKVDSKFFSSSSARDFAKEAAKIICPLQDEWSDPSKGTEQERKRYVPKKPPPKKKHNQLPTQ